MKQNHTYPKISIVTPNYNMGEYIEYTILSVLNQDYPNLEYIVIDGGSTDESINIIKKYENSINYWISEKDSGMYSAIQKGFEKATGTIMMWLNSDDLLYPKALFTIAEIFEKFEDVHWLTGIPSAFDENGKIVKIGSLKLWNKYDFFTDNYRWIQQESTVWRRELWEKAGARLDDKLKLAGDFELWLRFFQLTKLYSIDTVIGGFRLRNGQLSSNACSYSKECDISIAVYRQYFSLADKIKTFIYKYLLKLTHHSTKLVSININWKRLFCKKHTQYLRYDIAKKSYVIR